MPAVLDASFLIDLQRRAPEAVRLFEELQAEGEALMVPSIVLAEYLAGSARPLEDLGTLERAATLASFSPEDALAAARLARSALEEGSFPGWNDTLIAGFAAGRGAVVVTANPRHFPGVGVRTYRTPP